MLVSATEMLKKAKEGHYAVGQFNINNLEWTKAILATAQELNSPVILPFPAKLSLSSPSHAFILFLSVTLLFNVYQMLLFSVTDIRFQLFLRECTFKCHFCQHTNGLRGVFIKRNQA